MVNASDLLGDGSFLKEIAAPAAVREIAPPPPAPVVAQEAAPAPPSEVSVAPEVKLEESPKLVQKTSGRKSMLSRTARSQMALLATKPQSDNTVAKDFYDDQDDDSGADDPDLHRSFSRPKVVDENGTPVRDTDDLAISDHAKFRLFMARMKALDAHQAAQVAKQQMADQDAALSDSVKIRLALARMKAVQAHQKKFS